MKVLVACEFSGIVREAFNKRGHDAWSCDLLPTEIPGQHIQDDIKNVLRHFGEDWDLIIAFPPCTYLSVVGNSWFNPKYKDKFPDREKQRKQAILFFEFFTMLKTRKVCIENPVGIMSTLFRKPDQIIHPYYFGDPFKKRTCLWLKNLPLLQYSREDTLFWKKTSSVEPKPLAYYKKGKQKGKAIHWSDYQKPSKNRWKIRSKTFPGIAEAMAIQWG
jgi:site-specific DNA-cytosine methylase